MASSSDIPATVRALVLRSKGQVVVDTVPTPKLRDNYLLVKTTAVALNPTDWKSADALDGGGPDGPRVGCDYAGVVVAIGAAVTHPFKIGDRIAGGAHGLNQAYPQDGAFAEYITVKPDLAFKIPDGMSDEDASTVGLGATTVAQGFYQGLKLNGPSNPLKTPENLLIYGGATASGLLGIQFAKLANYRVLVTASAKNAAYLKSLGADEVFDYHDADAALSGIRAALGGAPLRYAWDCIASADTAQFCARALALTPATAAAGAAGAAGPGSLHYYNLLPVDSATLTAIDPRIEGGYTLYYTAFGEAFDMWKHFPADPAHLAFARGFWEQAGDLLARGKVKPARAYVNRGGSGLEGAIVGLRQLKAGDVSAGKLVYTIGK